MSFPTPDRAQALRQLELLGGQPEGSTYLRFFYPSNDPRKREDRGRKADRLNWQEIENYQRQGRGVYFVVNGGGHKNEDVKEGRAIFMEHDHLDKEVQRDLWKALALPEPTFQVDTGGKSIHSYWVFHQPVEIERWCQLQKDLLEYADADRAIKNPARVMRLAGAWYLTGNGSNGNGQPRQSCLISDSGKKYSYDELRSSIPTCAGELNESPLELPVAADGGSGSMGEGGNVPSHPPVSPTVPLTSNGKRPKRPEQIQLPVPAAVPLLTCCRQEVREWVAAGVPQGSGRNDAAISVGLELVAVERSLQQLGQPYSESARQLFSEYCQRSGMSAKEDEERWNWCRDRQPAPSCGGDGIEACIRAWYWREKVKPKRTPKGFSPSPTQPSPPPQKVTVTGDTPLAGDASTPELLGVAATVTTVTAVLHSGLKDYEERAELDAVEERSSMSRRSFWDLVAALRCSFDEVRPEDARRLEQLINWHDASLDFRQVLPEELASAFLHDAEILNIDPVSLWQYFLPAVLSLVGRRVSFNVESHDVPAIAWTCLVAESGTGKTRAENVVLAPIKQKQIQERRRWEALWQEYQKALKAGGKGEGEPEPPAPERKYLFEVATIQAVMRRLSEQGLNGSLWARDELAGIFKSLGQFSKRGGENEGMECLLRLWDGGAAFVERVDAAGQSYVAEQTRLSLAGGIQPQAFRQAFKDPDDPQGVQARFLYAVPKVRPAKRVKGYCHLSDLLPSLYDWCETCPTGTLHLSPEADRRYSDLVEQIGKQAETCPTPAIRSWMRKLPSQLMRVALCLHLVECYFHRHRHFHQLQKDTLDRAAQICRYYRNAFQVVQEKASDSEATSSILLKIWDQAATQPEGVTPRDLYRSIKALGRRATELGRQVGAYTLELLSKLVEMGKGTLEKEGRFYRFFVQFNPPSSPPEPPGGPSPSPGGIDSPSIPNAEFGMRNSETPVTGVTDAGSQSGQGFKASPQGALSPVTVQEVKSEGEPSFSQPTSPPQPSLDPPSQHLTWLLQLLADLEQVPLGDRFTSNDQLAAVLAEAEEKGQQCQEQLERTCPSYWQRLGRVLASVTQVLAERESGLEVQPADSVPPSPTLPLPPSAATDPPNGDSPQAGWRQVASAPRQCWERVERALTDGGEPGSENLLDGLT